MRSLAYDYAGYIPDDTVRPTRHYTFVLYDEDGQPYIGGLDYLTDEDGAPYIEEMSYLSPNNISQYSLVTPRVHLVYPGDEPPTVIDDFWIDMGDVDRPLYRVVS